MLCCGEFGRTPKINPAGGRDHWPNGFSLALAGGGIRAGRVIGATDPEGSKDAGRPVGRGRACHRADRPRPRPAKENTAPATRPIKLSQGLPIAALVE